MFSFFFFFHFSDGHYSGGHGGQYGHGGGHGKFLLTYSLNLWNFYSIESYLYLLNRTIWTWRRTWSIRTRRRPRVSTTRSSTLLIIFIEHRFCPTDYQLKSSTCYFVYDFWFNIVLKRIKVNKYIFYAPKYLAFHWWRDARKLISFLIVKKKTNATTTVRMKLNLLAYQILYFKLEN